MAAQAYNFRKKLKLSGVFGFRVYKANFGVISKLGVQNNPVKQPFKLILE